MARSSKPYPGMGKYVVITREGVNSAGEDVWVAYAGANTEEGARKRKREMSHYPSDRIKIVENAGPLPHPYC